MTNKKFTTLMFVSILFAISAAISINLNTQNYNFKDRGEIFLNNFTQNINDINVIESIFHLLLTTIHTRH